MYLDERSNLLLKELIFNPTIKSKELVEKHGLSRHQIGYSIDKINHWLLAHDLPIIEKSKSGFFLVDEQVQSYLKMEGNTSRHYILSEYERAQLIILMILSKQEELSLHHFTSALLVSKNTILNDLKVVQEILQPHSLTVSYSRQYGYEMIGSEIQKRRLLLQVIDKVLAADYGETMMEDMVVTDKARKQEISEWLSQVEEQLQLTFTDEKLKQLPYLLMIIFIRIEEKERIGSTFCIHYEELSDTTEYQAVELLLGENSSFPRAERLFMALNLLASNVSSNEVLTDTTLPELKNAVAATLRLFEKNACLTLKDKESLIRLIFIHMKPAYYRIKYHLTTSNEYAEKIDAEFGELHFLVKQSVTPLEAMIGETIPESELVYLTMFIGGWLERQGDSIHAKVRAVVICPNGLSVSKLMNHTLQKVFPEFHFLEPLSIREFQQFEQDYDIVFSPRIVQTDKQLFIVRQLPSEEEKAQLRKRVMQALYGYSPTTLDVDKIMEIVGRHGQIADANKLKKELQHLLEDKQGHFGRMLPAKQNRLNLMDFLTEDVITIVPSVVNWQEAIHLAAMPLLANGAIESSYITAIINGHQYEQPYMVLGQHVSIPHASPEKGVNRTAMSLLCIRDGVDFAKDFRVHLVVIIAAKDKEKHIRALFQLSQLALVEKDVFQIANAADKHEIVNIMRVYAEKDEDT
ncbi:PTS sugar transporter subunit IIA [Lysinibacillus piscis]|uniref:Ascorbate-specific PTS system EIIA component n=2 Tax=Lysinibacillus piscis TaxID=2518931 RepID=A0ABQ5NGI4_9BACI|nr:BglG family transcription antiterminator [Lysinibacillus sp. KH24]GLC87154.1 PTS sugar transporter subunit IIA [Lysinibacillus sp. KH24]